MTGGPTPPPPHPPQPQPLVSETDVVWSPHPNSLAAANPITDNYSEA